MENMEEGVPTLSYSVVPASTPVSSFTSLTAVSATARNTRLITHETHKPLNTISVSKWLVIYTCGTLLCHAVQLPVKKPA